MALIGAFRASPAIIGPDSRLSPDAYWSAPGALAAPNQVGASGRIYCYQVVKTAHTETIFRNLGTAQLVLEQDKLLTSAHLFMTRDGQLKTGLDRCVFIPFFHPEAPRTVNLSSLRLLPVDLAVTADDFWKYDVAVVRLDKALDARPYALMSPQAMPANGLLISEDSRTAMTPDDLEPALQNCQVRDPWSEGAVQLLFTDCDILDVEATSGGGPSGAAFLVQDGAELKVAGVLRGDYHLDANGSPYDRDRNSTVFIGLSAEVRRWIQKK